MGFADFLGVVSGSGSNELSEKLLFNSVIGFRGIIEGVGTSTIVQSLAIALSQRTNKRICVVDTNILYPAQYTMLCGSIASDARATMKDWFSSEVSLPERIIDTKYKHVSLLGCFNRRISDAFSSLDTTKLAEETFDKLKDIFDIILVDLSHEWSQVAMASAVQCNKIFTVLDLSSQCLNNVQQSLNNLAISAVPFAKFSSTIVNKYSTRGITGVGDVIQKSKLNVVATMPYSSELYRLSTLGKSPWNVATNNNDIALYNEAIDQILCSIVNETPLEIIDMAEREEIEQAIADSTVKNKAKARKIVLREREALLHPASEEEKEAARNARYEKIKQRSQADIAEDDEQGDENAIDTGFNLEEEDGRYRFGEDGDAL